MIFIPQIKKINKKLPTVNIKYITVLNTHSLVSRLDAS